MQGADQHERDGRDVEIAEHRRGGEDRRERDDGDAGGEAIEAVDEIEGVRDRDDPEDRERDRDPSEVQHRRSDTEDLDSKAQLGDDQGGDALRDDLGERANAPEVIDESGAKEHGTAEKQREHEAVPLGGERVPRWARRRACSRCRASSQ